MGKRVCRNRALRLPGGEGERGNHEQVAGAGLLDIEQIVPAQKLGVLRHVTNVDDGQASAGLEHTDHFAQRRLAAGRAVDVVNGPA
jgi:hypothetical protein